MSTHVSLRLDKKTIRKITARARSLKCTRSEYLRSLIAGDLIATSNQKS